MGLVQVGGAEASPLIQVRKIRLCCFLGAAARGPVSPPGLASPRVLPPRSPGEAAWPNRRPGPSCGTPEKSTGFAEHSLGGFPTSRTGSLQGGSGTAWGEPAVALAATPAHPPPASGELSALVLASQAMRHSRPAAPSLGQLTPCHLGWPSPWRAPQRPPL